MQKGTLFLIPMPLAEQAAHKSFTPFLVDTINRIDTYIVENEKTARKFLKEAGLTIPQNQLIIFDYGKHQRDKSIKAFFSPLESGKDVGLMSEAGCPGIADPGAELVAEAHKRNIKVVPLVGPNSMLQALMASGMSGQSYAFTGYLPIGKAERTKRLKDLEQLSQRYGQTQIFMETPFRNNQLLEELLKTLQHHTQLCVACHINGKEEYIKTQSVANWRKEKIDLHKKPVVFLIYKEK